MPFGKISKKAMKKFDPSRKRKYKKRVASKDIGTAKRLSVVNGPLSNTLKAQLLYTTDTGFSLVSAGTNPGTRIYSLNGMFDPDITGVGHQPRGFDNIMNLYDHYVVIGAKVRIDLHNNSTSSAAYVIATIRDSATESTNYTDYTESLNSQWKILGVESAGSADKSINLKINPNQFLGRSAPLADPELKGSDGTNPTEQCYLHLSGMNLDQFNACNVLAMVTIEYTAIFIEPKQPAQS